MSTADTEFGIEGMTDEDRAYAGSRYAEVRDALFANPYQRVWGAPGEAKWPVYKVTIGSVTRGILPFGRPHLFSQAIGRTVDSHADLRWGPDRKGYRRLLHPNGICLLGTWEITHPNDYTGYFRQGSKALLITRYSTCCTDTCRSSTRSLSMVGKLFPTTDESHAEPLRTANFITQQDIGGDWSDTINDVELLNAPDTTLLRRGLNAHILVLTGLLFGKLDRMPSIRQLYPIAEMGLEPGQRARTPAYMRLTIAAEQPRIEGTDLDFRDELMAQLYDRGDPMPKRTLSFDIDVTHEGTTRGLPIKERRTFSNWKRIGRMVFHSAVASYNGDHVIHFNHPTWREDVNDPATATRVGEKKVR